jgi:hypothetical protein
MSSRRFLLVVDAAAQIAVGPEFVNRCVDLAAVSAAITGQNSKLIELTSDQWQFLRGVYAMNPEAPPGLPPGDKAVFRPGYGDANGLLFFVDGDTASTPMTAPPALLSLMDQVAGGPRKRSAWPIFRLRTGRRCSSHSSRSASWSAVV